MDQDHHSGRLSHPVNWLFIIDFNLANYQDHLFGYRNRSIMCLKFIANSRDS